MAKRLFLAVNISDDVRREVSVHIRALKAAFPEARVGWARAHNLHITIKFLGDTEEKVIPELIETLHRVTERITSFTFSLAGAEILGKRVISIKVRDESSTVFSLEMMVDTECEKLGFKREGRGFHPHLTLGRIREAKGNEGLTRLHLQSPVKPLSFPVNEIVLYESELTPRGSVYKIVRSFPFGRDSSSG